MRHIFSGDAPMQVGAALASAGAGVSAAVSDISIFWLGVPMPVVLAAFAGSACALSFLGALGRLRAMTIVAVCTVIGTYLQPLIGHWTGIPASIWPALAFATGLLGHVVGTALFGAVPDAVRDSVAAIIEKLRGGRT